MENKKGALQLQKFIRFATGAGIAWFFDLGIFTFLFQLTGWIILPNILSGTLGIIFMFFVCLKKTFVYDSSEQTQKKFWIYFIFQWSLLVVSSFLIEAFYQQLILQWSFPANSITSTLSKILVIPLTLLSNYFFLQRLMERGKLL